MNVATPQTKTERRSWSNRVRDVLSVPEVGVLIPLLAFALIFYAINPVFLSPDNITTMLRAMSFVGVIAVGQTLLMISGRVRSFGGRHGGAGGNHLQLCNGEIAACRSPSRCWPGWAWARWWGW